MAITRFPLETDQPVVEVTLPPGRHVLELVVEDSAGLRSEPDTVTITIENVLPEISGKCGFPTMAIDFEAMGAKAVNILDNNKAQYPKILRIPPALIMREGKQSGN